MRQLSVTYIATLLCSRPHAPLSIIVEEASSYRCVTCWSPSVVILELRLMHGDQLFESGISNHVSRSLCNSRCISTKLECFSGQIVPAQSSKLLEETGGMNTLAMSCWALTLAKTASSRAESNLPGMMQSVD
jgi:hypothetical protein